MNKRLVGLLALCLALLCAATALAETYYVRTDDGLPIYLRDEITNDVIAEIPYGTALTPHPIKSTDICAYVTYNGVSGFAMWKYLTRQKPEATPVPTATPEPEPEATPEPQPTAAPYTRPVLRTLGCVIQYADDKGRAYGPELTEVEAMPSDNFVLTALVPKGQKISYWVINGTRYDIGSIKKIRLKEVSESFVFEVVCTGSTPISLFTPEMIQAARTGRRLELTTLRAEFCHLKTDKKGAGGWITYFDFTQDYYNRATGYPEQGGQISAKIRAIVPNNMSVIGWRINNGTELYPSGTVEQFIIRTLDRSMTYEPIFQRKATPTAAPPTQAPPSRPPTVTVTTPPPGQIPPGQWLTPPYDGTTW